MQPFISVGAMLKIAALAWCAQQRLGSLTLVLLFSLWPIALAERIQADPPGSRISEGVLTTVHQIHQLTTQAAAGHHKVRLKGVATALSTWPNAFFFQDATGALSIESTRLTGVFNGAEVEVTGQTAAGMFAPIVEAQHVRVLGKGTMPRARLYAYSALMDGSHDSQWIELRGIVRSEKVVTIWNQSVLSLMVEAEGHLATIHISQFANNDLSRFVDARVRMQGVCISYFNEKRQFTALGLHLRSTADIWVERPPPPDPFALPVEPIRELLQFQPGKQTGHRVQVEGTVTYQNPGKSLYIQDGSDGVLVETGQDISIPLGTRIRAVGFPVAGAYAPVLRDAILRQLHNDKLVTPLTIHATDFLPQGKFVIAPYDSQLVHLQGQLVERIERINDESWILRDGNKSFEAVLRRNSDADTLHIENGSIVSVTGILAVQVDEARQPLSSRILLRGPSDLVVLKRASWWTPQHALAVLGALLLVTLAIALWGILLKRTVRRQTRMLRQSEERFRSQAQRDTLTGLGSRSFLQEQLAEATRRAQKARERVGVLMVDLDNFKKVNDTLGHHAGDTLLCLVADRMRASVRKLDLVARTGGDEFIILLQDIKDHEEAKAIGAKIVANISQPAFISGHRFLVSASVGVSLYPDDGTDANVLLQNTDVAMYQSKAAGRNTLSVYTAKPPHTRRRYLEQRHSLKLARAHDTPFSIENGSTQPKGGSDPVANLDHRMQEKALVCGQLIADLEQALETEQFLLHFQIQVDQKGTWVGAEGLLRWQHPRFGLLSPKAFLSLAEQKGMMDALGQWVIDAACTTLNRWSGTKSLACLTLALNVSAHQFRHPQFADQLEAAVDRAWVDPHRLMLEFTEGLGFSPLEETRNKMQRLRERGIRFAIDDFGCGYSSLSYLQNLPIDQIKIDQSFIQNISTNPHDAVIVRSVLALGHRLGLNVVAEGSKQKSNSLCSHLVAAGDTRASSSADQCRLKNCY